MKDKINKIKFLILIFVFGIFLVGCAKDVERKGLFEDALYQAGKGVVVEYREGTPPREIADVFSVAVELRNYNMEDMQVELDVWDSVTSEEKGGFVDETDRIVGIRRAEESNGRRIYGREDIFFGIFSYRNVEIGESVQFFARINYDDKARNNFNMNLVYPRDGTVMEVISGKRLGDGVNYEPVSVTKVEKEIIAVGENEIVVNLDIVIENLGGGKVVNRNGDSVLNFLINSREGELEFRCNSKDSEMKDSDSLDIEFSNKENKVEVKCKSNYIEAGTLKSFNIDIEMRYGYEYVSSIGGISLIAR